MRRTDPEVGPDPGDAAAQAVGHGPVVEGLDAVALRLPVDADEETDGTARWDATTMVLVRAHAAGATGTVPAGTAPTVLPPVDPAKKA